jgi:hypothetical protein
MIVITSKEFRNNQKKFFDLAAIQRVIIKRKNQFLELVPIGEVIPDGISPSNDPYFNDPQQVNDILQASEQMEKGKGVTLTTELRNELFGEV